MPDLINTIYLIYIHETLAFLLSYSVLLRAEKENPANLNYAQPLMENNKDGLMQKVCLHQSKLTPMGIAEWRNNGVVKEQRLCSRRKRNKQKPNPFDKRQKPKIRFSFFGYDSVDYIAIPQLISNDPFAGLADPIKKNTPIQKLG